MGASAKKRSHSKIKTPLKNNASQQKHGDSFIQPAPMMHQQAHYDDQKVDEEPLRRQDEDQVS